jgi:DNA repair photolyase
MNRIRVTGVYYVQGLVADRRCASRLERMLQRVSTDVVKEVSLEELDALVASLGTNLGSPAHPYLFLGRFQRLTPAAEQELSQKYPHLHQGGYQRLWGANHFSYWSSIGSVDEGCICHLRWTLDPCVGCFHACTYCGFRNLTCMSMTLNVEDLIARNREIMRLVPSQKNWHTGGASDIFCFEPEYGYTEQLLNTAAAEDRNVLFYTSTDNVDFLRDLEHRDRAIIEWTISPEGLVKWERRAPSLRARLEAMKKCQDAGCTVRCQFAPFVPLVNWKDEYRDMLRKLFSVVEPDFVAIHMVRWCGRHVSRTLREWFGESGIDPEYMAMVEAAEQNGGMAYFPGGHNIPAAGRERIYRFMIDEIRAHSAEIPIVLCRETPEMWDLYGGELNVSPANCGCGTLPRTRNSRVSPP